MENAKDLTRFIPKTATGRVKEELTLCLLDAERGSPLKGQCFSVVSDAVEAYLLKSLLASPKRTCLLIQKMYIPNISHGAARNHSLSVVVINSLDHCLRRIEDLTNQEHSVKQKVRKSEEKYRKCRSSPYRSSRGLQGQHEERVEIAERERCTELIGTYENEKDMNERTVYSIISSWHSFDPYGCTDLIHVILDLCHAKKLLNIFQLYCCLLASGKNILNLFCKPEEEYIYNFQESMIHKKKWEKEENCDSIQCSYLVPLDCKTLCVICIGQSSHILKEVVENFSLIPDTLVSSKAVESWVAHYPAWLGPLWPFFFNAFWVSATDKVSSSQHLSLLWDKRPYEGDPVFLKASQSLKQDLRTLHWCIHHSNTLHVASLLKLVCDYSPLYALNKAVPFHRLNNSDVLLLLEEYEKEGKNAETAAACKMTFLAYTLMSSLMHVLSAGMHLDNAVTGRKLRNGGLNCDDDSLLDLGSTCSNRLVDINAMKAYYQTSIVRRLEEIKNILGRIQPLAYKVEMIENIFSMLFVRHSDLSDEILSDSGEEGGELEKSTFSQYTDVDSLTNFPMDHTPENTLVTRIAEDIVEKGYEENVDQNGWREERKRASASDSKILDVDETAAVYIESSTELVNLSIRLRNSPVAETNLEDYRDIIDEREFVVEPFWKVERQENYISSDCEKQKGSCEPKKKHKTKGKSKRKSVIEVEKAECSEEGFGNVESDSSTVKRRVEDTQSSATLQQSSGTSAKSTASSFRELPRTGFLCNVLVTWDILLLLKDIVVAATAESFASHSKEAISGQCNVRMSIKLDLLKSRLNRISKYVNDALWRLSVVCPRIREFGSLNEFEDYCSSVLLLTGPPSLLYQSVISNDSDRAVGKKPRLVPSCVKTSNDYRHSIANFLLAPPSSLISIALANNNLVGAHQVVQAFSMKDGDDKKEVEFSDRFAELKPKVLHCEAVRQKSRIDTKLLTSGTKTLHGLGLLAREGMAQVGVANIINDLITAAPPPVPPVVHNLIGALDQHMVAVVRTFQVPQAMVYADVALTHELSYSTAIQLLELVLQRVSSQDRNSFMHCKLALVGYVPIVRQMNEVSSAFKNIAASGTKATLVKACAVEQGTPNHLLISCLPLSAHSLANFFTNWAKVTEHIFIMEDLLYSEAEETRASTSIHRVYKNLLHLLREERRSLAGKEVAGQQMAYLRTFYQYLQLLSVMVDRHTGDDQSESFNSYFRLLNQRPVHILGNLMFEKGVKPSLLEPITVRMCLNLTNVILQYSCPKLTIPKSRTMPNHTRQSTATRLHEIGCQIDGRRIILNAGGTASHGDIYGDVIVRNVLGTLKATLCEMIELRTVKKYSSTAQVVDDNTGCIAINSPDIQMSLRETSDLISADLTKMSSEEEKLTFFINLANLMFLHAGLVNHLVYSPQQDQLRHQSSRGLFSSLYLERLISMRRFGYIVGNLGFVSLYDVVHEYLEQSDPSMMLLQGESREYFLSSMVTIPRLEKKKLVKFDVPVYTSFLLTTGSIVSPKIQIVYSDRVAEQGTTAMNEYVASHLYIQYKSVSQGQPKQDVSMCIHVTKSVISAANKNAHGLLSGILDFVRQSGKMMAHSDCEELSADIVEEDDQPPGIILEFGCEQELHETMETNKSASENEEKEELYDSWHWKKINVPHSVLAYLEKQCSPLAKLVSSLHDRAVSKIQEDIENSRVIVEWIKDAASVSPEKFSSKNLDLLDTAKKPMDYVQNLFYMSQYRVLSVLHQGSCTVAALKTKVDVEDLWLALNSILSINPQSLLLQQGKKKHADQTVQERSSVQNAESSFKENSFVPPTFHDVPGIASIEAAEAAVALLDAVNSSRKELHPDLFELQDILLYHLTLAVTSQDGGTPWKYTWRMQDANLRSDTIKHLLSWFPHDAAMSQLAALSSDLHLSKQDRVWAYNHRQQLHVYGQIVKADLGYCSWQEVGKVSQQDPAAVLQRLLQKQLFGIGVAWARHHICTPQLQCLIDQSFLLTLLHATNPDFRAASEALDQLGGECVEPVVATLLEKISDHKVRRFLIEFVIKWFFKLEHEDGRAADKPDWLREKKDKGNQKPENKAQSRVPQEGMSCRTEKRMLSEARGHMVEEKVTEGKDTVDKVKSEEEKDEKTMGDFSKASLCGNVRAKKDKLLGVKKDTELMDDKIVIEKNVAEEVKDSKVKGKFSEYLDVLELNQECMGLLLVEDIAPHSEDKFQLYHLSKTPLLMFEQWLMNIRLEAVEQGVNAISGYLNAITHWQEKVIPDSYRYIQSRDRMLTWDSYNALVEHYAAKALDTSGVQMMPKGGKTKAGQQDQLQFTMPSSPPKASEWMPDDQVKYCTVCNVAAFSLFCRRHHCRRCGRVVCGSCSKARMDVEGYAVKVRVCSDCFRQAKEINLSEYIQVRPLGDDPCETSISETSGGLQSPQGSTTWSFESEGGWYLTQQEEHNSLVRNEFSYDYAPSLSLSLAILSLHRCPQQAALHILQLCHNLLVLFSSSLSSPSAEIDHTFLLSMVHTLLMAAKLRFANANFTHGVNACEFIEERIELFKLLIKSSCTHLFANAPVENAVRLVELRINRLKGEDQDQDEISRLMKNEFSFFRQIRDALVREQQWQLALTVSTKRGFETQSVLSSWGLTCLKAGDFTGARERLSRVLQRPVDKNKGFVSSLLPVIIRELERNNFTVDQQVIEQVEQLPALLISKDQQAKLPPEALLIQWCRETHVSIEMGRLGEPIGLSDSFAARLSTRKKNLTGRLHPHFLKECKYYLRLYGSHSMNLQFLIRHNHLQDCLDYVINEEPNVIIFVEDVFLPLMREGHMEQVILLMRRVDPQLQNWVKYLRGACLFLEKKQWWYSLLSLQENLRDYLRAAMTLHKLYLFYADSYLSLQNHVHFLTAAIKHLKAHLDGQSWIKPHRMANGEATALKYEMPGRTVNRHINTFSLQGDVVKVLAAWEQGGAPIQSLLQHMHDLGLKVYGHNSKQRVSTLLADKVEAMAVVMLLLLCGKSMENEAGLAYRVLETVALSPKSMLTLGAKLLVVTQRYSEVGQLVQVASEWGLQKASSVDAALQPAIMIARRPPHQPNLDLLVKLLTSDSAKVNTYIECGRLKSAYLVAVHGSRWDHVTRVKEAAEKTDQRHVAVMCDKWMASFNYRVRK